VKIAIVGSGISGLAFAYLASKNHETHLFEAAPRLGGHANTVKVPSDGKEIPVDTGFIVYNELNYPHLSALFKHLDVPTSPSEMTLSIAFTKKNLEWGGKNLSTVFAQKSNLFNKQFLRMIWEILSFHRNAERFSREAEIQKISLGELLQNAGYSRALIDLYLAPMASAIWSTSVDRILEYPAESFFRFCLNHRLLQVEGRPAWRTVRGGSCEYVKRIVAKIDNIWLGSAVKAVERIDGKIRLKTKEQDSNFDMVVFATHPPDTLKILSAPNPLERELLSSFKYQKNQALLHRTESLMPARKKIWSSWNFRQPEPKSELAETTYWMNLLQPLATKENFFVTLNPLNSNLNADYQETYEHPLFDRAAISAQSRINEIQGEGGIYHIGAWSRFGFHEDGILSAANLATHLGWEIPWMSKT
jgi:predicted NAD/FAD-binding protein